MPKVVVLRLPYPPNLESSPPRPPYHGTQPALVPLHGTQPTFFPFFPSFPLILTPPPPPFPPISPHVPSLFLDVVNDGETFPLRLPLEIGSPVAPWKSGGECQAPRRFPKTGDVGGLVTGQMKSVTG